VFRAFKPINTQPQTDHPPSHTNTKAARRGGWSDPGKRDRDGPLWVWLWFGDRLSLL